MTRIRAFTAATVLVLTAGLLATAPAQPAHGDLDPIFSGDGKETTNFGKEAFGSGVALQTDGKIVVAGTAFYRCARTFGAVLPLNSRSPVTTRTAPPTLVLGRRQGDH
jgi:hypothetical protein